MLNAGIPMEAFLVVSTLMFFAGVYGFLTRRNLITILMSVELILNSVNINFLVFNRFLFPDKLQGHFFSLFIIAIAAAEAAVAIAIIINIYRHFNSINVENVDKMRY
jgi:NADH:ubiquinone oxidoreductase subunit K